MSLQCKYVGRMEKITIPGYILTKVDDYAKSLGMTRSGFLVQDIMVTVHSIDPSSPLRTYRCGAARAIDIPGVPDSVG